MGGSEADAEYEIIRGRSHTQLRRDTDRIQDDLPHFYRKMTRACLHLPTPPQLGILKRLRLSVKRKSFSVSLGRSLSQTFTQDRTIGENMPSQQQMSTGNIEE